VGSTIWERIREKTAYFQLLEVEKGGSSRILGEIRRTGVRRGQPQRDRMYEADGSFLLGRRKGGGIIHVRERARKGVEETMQANTNRTNEKV